MLCAEQTRVLDEYIALDLCSLGALALPGERARQVCGRDERTAVVSIENAPVLLERALAKCLRFCVLSHAKHRAGEFTRCGERVLSSGLYGERRPQEHHRLRALSEVQKRGSQVPRRRPACWHARAPTLEC